jgi:hypothetical protein
MFKLQAHRGYPEVVDCRWGVIEIRNLKVQGTRNFRQVRAAICVIPYILCGGLYCLRCYILERVPAYPYIVWGTGLYRSPSQIQSQESYPSTTQIVFLCSKESYFCTSSYNWCRTWAMLHPLSWKIYVICAVPWSQIWQASELFLVDYCSLLGTFDGVFEFFWTSSWRCLPSTSLAASRLWGAHNQVVFKSSFIWGAIKLAHHIE